MSEVNQEVLVDLLTKRATEGLDAFERKQFDELISFGDGYDDLSFDIAAAAISMIDFDADEPMPAKIRSSIMAKANTFFSSDEQVSASARANPQPATTDDMQPTFAFAPRKPSILSWLGWAVAAAACVALAINLMTNRVQTPQIAGVPTPLQSPQRLDPAQSLVQLLASNNVVKAKWAVGNVKELKDISGDVVWSDEKQVGYIRVHGLPKNDPSKETYQLWIFDETQDKTTPIDGGTFDVSLDGDIVIPINSKLKAKNPALFAITIEKPGGVVVSKRGRIAALATVGKTET